MALTVESPLAQGKKSPSKVVPAVTGATFSDATTKKSIVRLSFPTPTIIGNNMQWTYSLYNMR